jgi:hypothetical protein
MVLTLPIREADYMIEPAKGDQGEAEFVHSVLMTPDTEGGMKTTPHELVGQVTTAQVMRRSFFETTWKIRDKDGKIVLNKVAFRPPATCTARYNSRTGAPNGFRQQVWMFGQAGEFFNRAHSKVPGYVDIPKLRSYIYTHGRHREPLTGVSEMDIAYWCFQTKMKLLYLWYHFLENQAMPRTIVYGNDPTEAATRADDIASLKSSGVVGLVHPEAGQKAFEVIPSTDSGGFFKEALGFLEQWQIGSVLAGFMGLTGAATGGRGSYALSQDQSSFYLKSRQAVAKEIAESITYDVIRPLVLLNFGTSAVYPSWKFGPLQDEQIQALLTMFQTLAAAPALHIPLQVLDLITERMASILQLDIDQVHAALSSTANQRAEQLAAQAPPGMPTQAAAGLGALNGMANAAVGIAQQASQRGGLPARPPPPGPGQQAQPPRPPSGPPRVPPPGRMA